MGRGLAFGTTAPSAAFFVRIVQGCNQKKRRAVASGGGTRVEKRCAVGCVV